MLLPLHQPQPPPPPPSLKVVGSSAATGRALPTSRSRRGGRPALGCTQGITLPGAPSVPRGYPVSRPPWRTRPSSSKTRSSRYSSSPPSPKPLWSAGTSPCGRPRRRQPGSLRRFSPRGRVLGQHHLRAPACPPWVRPLGSFRTSMDSFPKPPGLTTIERFSASESRRTQRRP